MKRSAYVVRFLSWAKPEQWYGAWRFAASRGKALGSRRDANSGAHRV